ncbi:hypothetical protein FOA52_001878 [Chlamydomonas sp. UWO 241]|nr:hypothetical protein FOA52_001878 [Chlamydomonas sp. UWO 241]
MALLQRPFDALYATSYRFKNSDKVPGFVDRAFAAAVSDPAERAVRSTAAMVEGTHRYKHARRPMLAGPILIRQARAAAAPAPAPAMPEPFSKAAGTQSDYRENEAQTQPWDPEAVVPQQASVKQAALSGKHHVSGPELLKLKGMHFADGLPPGLAEVQRIEKMREKRAFEVTLPHMDDVSRLPERQRMIEAWENKEWAARDVEIRRIQDERLALLDQALLAREEEFDDTANARVDSRKAMQLSRAAEKFAAITASRVKEMRRLVESRKYVEVPRKLAKPGVVERAANYASDLYAPMAREGRGLGASASARPGMGGARGLIETEGFQPATLAGLAELQASMPAKLVTARIGPPTRPGRLDAKGRADAKVQAALTYIADQMDEAKATTGRGHAACWPEPLFEATKGRRSLLPARKAMQQAAEETVLPPPESRALQAAAVQLLQRLLRGRAAQNAMFDEKQRRAPLIAELLLEARGRASLSRPEQPALGQADLDAVVGAVLSSFVVALAAGDAGALAALMAEEPGARRPVPSGTRLKPLPPPEPERSMAAEASGASQSAAAEQQQRSEQRSEQQPSEQPSTEPSAGHSASDACGEPSVGAIVDGLLGALEDELSSSSMPGGARSEEGIIDAMLLALVDDAAGSEEGFVAGAIPAAEAAAIRAAIRAAKAVAAGVQAQAASAAPGHTAAARAEAAAAETQATGAGAAVAAKEQPLAPMPPPAPRSGSGRPGSGARMLRPGSGLSAPAAADARAAAAEAEASVGAAEAAPPADLSSREAATASDSTGDAEPAPEDSRAGQGPAREISLGEEGDAAARPSGEPEPADAASQDPGPQLSFDASPGQQEHRGW